MSECAYLAPPPPHPREDMHTAPPPLFPLLLFPSKHPEGDVSALFIYQLLTLYGICLPRCIPKQHLGRGGVCIGVKVFNHHHRFFYIGIRPYLPYCIPVPNLFTLVPGGSSLICHVLLKYFPVLDRGYTEQDSGTWTKQCCGSALVSMRIPILIQHFWSVRSGFGCRVLNLW
jgi:hypothetical protein